MAGANSYILHRWGKWLNWWTLLCLPGIILATTVWGIRGTLLVSTATGFLTFLVLSGFRTSQWAPTNLAWKARWILRVGTCAVAGFLTLIVIAQWVGPLWLLLVAAMALTSPPGAARARRWIARLPTNRPLPDPSESPEPSAPARLPESPERMSDVELCFLWRHSFWDLTEATSPDRRAEIVAQRELILNELIRRNSTAIEAWLATEPRASDSPERFFRGDDHGHATAA